MVTNYRKDRPADTPEWMGVTKRFVIAGEPYGKGRPKFDTRGPYVRAITPKKTVNYETAAKIEYELQCGNFHFPREAALVFRAIAYKPIPKSVSNRKRELMLAHKIRPGKKPDWDNVGKIICDALNGIAYSDDAQIVDGRTIKKYGEVPRVEVFIMAVAING